MGGTAVLPGMRTILGLSCTVRTRVSIPAFSISELFGPVGVLSWLSPNVFVVIATRVAHPFDVAAGEKTKSVRFGGAPIAEFQINCAGSKISPLYQKTNSTVVPEQDREKDPFF
ncbi:MAG TPA: hypothetical protein VL285_08520 [Bryobacteraceae bacterium]|jgi:hypothetical protein|nr:hypothetical protein [Bryobacteraceae bacterium]